ncbi:hypothetical protein Pmani_035368 [Petrolisthes manimaculis]|uniref:Uncharacterized protein n=1 Tax=Petrolisthes manimaculis TaxID=1843537 RepID=A0AAE1NKX8_9EUCA|nr:hypothetical protein Pmani_035368 [Petrolisthes manimaculis]
MRKIVERKAGRKIVERKAGRKIVERKVEEDSGEKGREEDSGEKGREEDSGEKGRSNREAGDDNSTREGGSTRHPPERRESGRFPSAARLLRSLARSRDDDSSGARAREPSEPRLTRSNPSYHSEGKGLKKKNNWTSERELNNSLSPTQKERSHSFCDKASNKRRYSYHDNKSHKEEARAAARLEQQRQEVNAQQDISSISSVSSPGGPREPLPPTPPSPSSSTLTPTPIQTPTPSSIGSPPLTASPEKVHENIYENLPAHIDGTGDLTINGDITGQDAAVEISGVSVGLTKGVTKGVTRPIERAERERRSVRKLTKDSGYETSPYSESDYANIDLCSEAAAAAAVVAAAAAAGSEGDGDDVTLAPESELAASTTLDTTDPAATR